MDIDCVYKGEKGKFHFAIALRSFEFVVGEYAVINSLTTSPLFVNLFPLLGVAGYRREQT